MFLFKEINKKVHSRKKEDVSDVDLSQGPSFDDCKLWNNYRLFILSIMIIPNYFTHVLLNILTRLNIDKLINLITLKTWMIMNYNFDMKTHIK